MKAKNNKDIFNAVVSFSSYLILTVFLAVCIFSSFMKTSAVEVHEIVEKTKEYDIIQLKQVALTEKIDSLYTYSNLLNSDPRINYNILFNTISKRRLSMNDDLENMSSKDVLLYKRLSSEINGFLRLKDSIRMAGIEEDLVRADLLRCIDDNKKTVRKISLGGIKNN